MSVLATTRVGDRLEVSLGRAPLNEIGPELVDALADLGRHLHSGADGARAVVLHSSLEAGFCAGADLRALHADLAARRSAVVARVARSTGTVGAAVATRVLRPVVQRAVGRFIERLHRAFDAIDTSPVPVVVAVHGPVFGGGLELMLLGDVAIADRSARFAFPELRLGLVPGFGGLPRLSRDVGNAVVRDLLFTGRSLGAERAYELGLVSQVVPRGEAVDAARRVADQIARFDPEVVAAAKGFAKPLPSAELRKERSLFRRLVGREAVFNALAKFVESRDVRPYLP